MSVLRRFSKYLRRQRGALVLGSGAILANTAMDLLKPWPLKVVVDHVIQNRPFEGGGLGAWVVGLAPSRTGLLNLAIGLAIAAVVLGGIFEYVGKRTLGGLGQRLMAHLRRDVFSVLQRRSLAFHDRQRVGDLVTRVTADSDKMQEALVHTLTMLIPAVVTMTAMAAIMAVLDWQVTVLALSITPVLFLITFGLGRKMRRAAKAARSHDGAVAAMAAETLSSIRVVQAFTREEHEDRRFGGYALASSLAGRRAVEMEARYGPLVDVTNVIGAAVTIWFGTHRVLAGSMSVGELLIILAYLGSFYKPMKQMAKLTQQVAKGAASADRIAEILEQQIEVRDGPLTARRPAGRIRFERVTFGYETGRPVLHELSVEIRPGEMVALVGPTGAGKSTLAGLVPRFADVWEGRVLLDDTDVREFTVSSLRDQVALVLQDPILFRGSIYDNIAYGSPSATRETVLTAARAARVDEFAESLPEGYDTPVGERGMTLSGGQRQRISIARAIVRDAPIVILDEPTSGLDSESEQLVMDALDRLTRGRTTIVIAHRLSTARRADRILVVEGGRIVEQGTHQELLAAGGRYRVFHDIQFDAGPTQDAAAPAARVLRSRADADVSFPLDPKIPGLVAVAQDGLASVLSRAGLGPDVRDVTLLKSHPGSRCTLAVTVGGRRVVVKAYRDAHDADAELLRRLADAGLATGRSPTVAPLVADIPELHVIVTEWLPGPRAIEMVRDGEGEIAGRRGAEWLHAVWATDVEFGSPYGPPEAIAYARRSADLISAAEPGLGRRAHRFADALESSAPPPGRVVLVHGSFSPSHVIDLGDGPGVIDWDGFARGPIELDAGRFVARLREFSGRSAAPAASEAERVFRAATSDIVSEEALAWYSSVAMVKLARYRARKARPGWQEHVSRLLDDAGRTLEPA